MRLDLLKNGAIIAILSCSLGLTACSSTSDEEDMQPVCLDETGVECVMIHDAQTALYLPEFSNQTYTVTTTQKTDTYYGSQNGTDLSFSRPAGEGGVSVKDKVPTPAPAPVQLVPETKQQITTEVKTVETKTVETKKPMPQVTKQEVKTEEKQEKVIAQQDKSKVAFGEECHDWEAKPGNTLRSLLMHWGEESGWTVIWQLDRDYHLEAGVIFRGTFTEVSGALIRSFARATPAPIGTFYKGNRVLVVNTQEDENAN